MSGKSTYLKQIALLTIISQLGCFVPCEYASFSIRNQIFTRLSHDDSMEASSFMVEMKDMVYILENIKENSLVIIDELGRSTSSFDAMGISCAICEELLRRKVITFFATHFEDMAHMMGNIYPKVVNLHLKVKKKD
jgi:DNA mismatch repair protein MSH4